MIELYIKNQNNRSEVSIKKDLPIRLLNYKKLNDDYFVNALTPGFASSSNIFAPVSSITFSKCHLVIVVGDL